MNDFNNFFAVIPNYCPVSNVPFTPSNAAATNISTVVNSVTTYTCNYGYYGNVSVICNPYNVTYGQWSSPPGNCTSITNYCCLIDI